MGWLCLSVHMVQLTLLEPNAVQQWDPRFQSLRSKEPRIILEQKQPKDNVRRHCCTTMIWNYNARIA
jgi:hypothetical protein